MKIKYFCKIIFSVSDLPHINTTSTGIERRIKAIDSNRKIKATKNTTAYNKAK